MHLWASHNSLTFISYYCGLFFLRRRGEVKGERETKKWRGRKREANAVQNILCQLSQIWIIFTKYLTSNSSHAALYFKSRILYHSWFLNKLSFLIFSHIDVPLLSHILWVKAYRIPSYRVLTMTLAHKWMRKLRLLAPMAHYLSSALTHMMKTKPRIQHCCPLPGCTISPRLHLESRPISSWT